MPAAIPIVRTVRAIFTRRSLWRNISLSQRRTLAVLGLYAATLIAAVLIFVADWGSASNTIALGLIAPGAGFLAWSNSAAGLFILTTLLFGLALVLWFGTGNIVLPPLIWFGSAAVAGLFAPVTSPTNQDAQSFAFAGGAIVCAVAIAITLSRRSPRSLPAPHWPWAGSPPADPEELAPGDLRLMRLLLDRALQPVGEFAGFEWRDQFQTAAVRYQLNFISYALSLAQARHTPAFNGYLAKAQRRLLSKQEDYRVWRYWMVENAWGHLSLAADPMPRGNIMYSGFVAAQMAYARSAGALADDEAALTLRFPNGRDAHYRLDDVASLLSNQYLGAPWGLLPCEPHWIYPMCNLISATALRAVDAQIGTSYWNAIDPGFRAGLDANFTTASGDLVPFRSSLTGLALPGAGGVVMQAFPCLFLRSLYPDLAERQWARTRAILARRKWSRAFWPIDVGNYGFSRASNLAASAAAAVEMGDSALATDILSYLEYECPATTLDGVMHRPRASLWAHALELIARVGSTGAFGEMVERPCRAGPRIDHVDYPDVLVAAAHSHYEQLTAILHGKTHKSLVEFAGLRPCRHYRLEGASTAFCRADAGGRATAEVTVEGRTLLVVTPVI